MFILNSKISIGNFCFTGVNDVRIHRSLHSLVETAVIKIPSIAKVVKQGQSDSETVTAGKQFADGDPVIIALGYNQEMQAEFTGFVKRREFGMPLTVHCEGYSWLLRRNRVNISKQSVKLKDYLALAIKGIDPAYSITIECDADITLNNVQVNGTGLDALELVSKFTDSSITCFFKRPNVLWCGLLYTANAEGKDALNIGSVKYRLGFNVIKDNSLRLRTSDDDPVQVVYNKKLSDGSRITGISDVFKNFARTHSKILNQIRDAPVLKNLAIEKAYKLNYSGYEGAIQTFLQPYASPGFIATITDTTYSEHNGDYVVESVETQFGINGARRLIEIGPGIGFAKTE